MENVKILRLIDLINDIKKVDALVQLHSNLNDSKIITNQYVAKKEKLIGYLIDELNAPKIRSQNSFLTIKLIIDKFYSSLDDNTYHGAFTKSDLLELEKAL
ncbi:MAG: hypothetical protein NT004_10895 [Bacteroidetes bacterium]|nr:hypothetical protein [Bacteroidota bacterium]